MKQVMDQEIRGILSQYMPLDDDDMEDGRGEGQDDGSQANSLNDSDNDF